MKGILLQEKVTKLWKMDGFRRSYRQPKTQCPTRARKGTYTEYPINAPASLGSAAS